MKIKLLLITLILFSYSCSKDENTNKCNEFVFGTSKTCNPVPNCIYKVKHGTDDLNVINEVVDEITYNYYNKLYEESIEEEIDVCWKE